MESIFKFLEQHSYYVVLIIVLIIWVGFFFYLFTLDRKVKRLERRRD
ncbi:MAG: CcmD family protein [Ignavibacteria bacterium]